MSEKNEFFWVAELVHSYTRHTLGGVYWDGHTRPVFEPVTTTDIHKALKFRDAATCQHFIDRLEQCKSGILVPVEHGWLVPQPATPDAGGETG